MSAIVTADPRQQAIQAVLDGLTSPHSKGHTNAPYRIL